MKLSTSDAEAAELGRHAEEVAIGVGGEERVGRGVEHVGEGGDDVRVEGAGALAGERRGERVEDEAERVGRAAKEDVESGPEAAVTELE